MADPILHGDKPAVLIIGGLGYIGRYLALHIHKNQLASEVRLVDKVLPQLAFLADEFAEACSTDKFMQADASREQSISRIFAPVKADQYDFVFNCGGETRYSQDDSVYTLRNDALTKTLARECARRTISAYIEFSSGMVYKSPSSATIAAGGCTETAPLKPWLKLAKHKLICEETLEHIRQAAANRIDGFEESTSVTATPAATEPPATNGDAASTPTAVTTSAPAANGSVGPPELRYVVLRLPHVYGEHDVGFLARGLCLARVYQATGERMEWLYGRELRVNTVHVADVAVAAWAAAEWTARTAPTDPEVADSTRTGGRVFNVVDDGDTRQEDVASIIGTIFEIPTGFQSALVNAFARFNLDRVVDDVNEDVLQPWADLLAEKNITRQGPIGPFMEKELLKDCDLCICADRAKRVLAWKPGAGREKLSEDRVREVVESYKKMGWWP